MVPMIKYAFQETSRTLQYSNLDVISSLNGPEKKSRSINKMFYVEDLDILVSFSWIFQHFFENLPLCRLSILTKKQLLSWGTKSFSSNY